MSAKLSWTAASKTGTSVAAYRPREDGVVLATLGPSQLTFTDDSAASGTAYDVIADFADGTSITSAAVTYTVAVGTVAASGATQGHTAGAPALIAPTVRIHRIRLVATTVRIHQVKIGAAAPVSRGYLTGLLARDDDHLNVNSTPKIDGFVQELRWNAAQTTPGGAITQAAQDALAAGLADATTYGYSNIKLRVFAGDDSPTWAKNLGGGPISNWADPVDGGLFTIPKWWAPEFLDAYGAFLVALRPYLTDSRWKEVTVSGASTVYAEPCVRQFADAGNRSTALAAGYTRALDIAAFERAIDLNHAAFSDLGISSSVAYNSFQQISDSGGIVTNQTQTFAFMDYQRSLMGPRGIWQNNSLGARRVNGVLEQVRDASYTNLYNKMFTAAVEGHPVQFQTMTLTKMQNGYTPPATPYDTADFVAVNGGVSVEMPVGWETASPGITQLQADDLNARMAANAAAL